MDRFSSFLESMFSRSGELTPRLFGALILLLLGYIVSKLIQRLVRKALNRFKVDERLDKDNKIDLNFASAISQIFYYISMLFVLMIVLDILGVTGVLSPLQNMLNEFLSFIPNAIAAGLIGFAGYMIARIASETVGFVSASLDHFSDRLGFKGSMSIANVLKQIVFLFIFVPVLLIALDALQISLISDPASQMLTTMMGAVPGIIAAAIILIVFYIAGKFIIAIIEELLRNLGADALPAKMGWERLLTPNMTLSNLVGNVLFFFLMFFAVISATEKLQFVQLTETLNNLMELTGQIILGLVIVMIGNYISILVADYMKRSNQGALIPIVRFATLGLFLAIALRTMGIANDIVNLAFGLTLGAVAVAFALSFGLGGREAAGKYMEHLVKRWQKKID
ncbi:MAG: mechanosensitive ion channel [Saprospiraceae bacterium]|nr:mechanosensitive ion channel [Saprospiraceae bacterium]